jgi:hypothetical protein
MEERHVGNVYVDSGQIVILEPTRLSSEDEYQRVVDVSLEKGAGEVSLRESKLEISADGVVVETTSDAVFPVFVTYDDSGIPTQIRIALEAEAE